ncbi:MAG: signal peptidase I [Anaplasmataceae bacterium]|nr:signal peptidase I [Anaplasmataceae bacterium]
MDKKYPSNIVYHDKTNNSKTKNKSSFLKSLITTLLIVFAFRTLVGEPFHIPSSSMLPNLMAGDYILVSKSSYGYSKYSMFFPLPDYIKGRLFAKLPARGDVVVFRNPKNDKINFIKRVIGLPGDKIKVIGGVVYINNNPIERLQLDNYIANINSNITQYKEVLESKKSYQVIHEYNDDVSVSNTGIYTVPENNLFVMGDNRDNSMDSRFLDDVGYIPVENLVGQAKMILLSFGFNSDDFFRFDRFFKKIV